MQNTTKPQGASKPLLAHLDCIERIRKAGLDVDDQSTPTIAMGWVCRGGRNYCSFSLVTETSEMLNSRAVTIGQKELSVFSRVVQDTVAKLGTAFTIERIQVKELASAIRNASSYELYILLERADGIEHWVIFSFTKPWHGENPDMKACMRLLHKKRAR